MKSLLYLFFSMSIFNSCDKGTSNAQSAFAVQQPAVEETKLNISYGKDSAQRMDIYLPAGRSVDSTKAIVLIHGGGWNAGDKRDFAYYIDNFKKKLPDYAIFNINYRLVGNSHLFPTQENDVKAAIDFIADHAVEYKFNKNKIALLGASAGAHLALLQAYKYPDPHIKTVIDFFGPTDLLSMYHQPWHQMIPFLLQMLTGTTPTANIEIYQQSSPIFFVSSQSAPTLILQGGRDNIVPLSQSQLLKNKLQKEGVKHDLIVYPYEGHGWYGANLQDSFDKITNFLNINNK